MSVEVVLLYCVMIRLLRNTTALPPYNAFYIASNSSNMHTSGKPCQVEHGDTCMYYVKYVHYTKQFE